MTSPCAITDVTFAMGLTQLESNLMIGALGRKAP